ncbi:MAG: fimbrillin family protein [Bacteroides sp.]|nr:fimbrillin family protein [Bacteroides sp.]
MKKNYFILAAAATLFAACAETDVLVDLSEKENAPKAIGFETFADNITRADEPTTKPLQNYHESFGVWAYKTTSQDAVMDNYQVKHNTSAWEYAGVSDQTLKYWDKKAAYSFYAYAPYAASGVTESNGKILIEEGDYAANENLQTWGTTKNTEVKFSVSTDWMIAESISNHKDYSNPVSEVFSHIMSKFIVKLQSNVADTKINSVTVSNVYGTGSYDGDKWVVTVGNTTSISAQSTVDNSLIIETAGTTYHAMEYLLIPAAVPPTFSVNYTVNGDTYNVENVAIPEITTIEKNTSYELTVKIDLGVIEFTAVATDFSSTVDKTLDIK